MATTPPEESLSPAVIAYLRSRLLSFFDEHRRDLPWRDVGDPYATWVSEIMLQQTRVATVIDYFERWMERFPTVEALADADREEVLHLWSGLGYYSRARRLHEGAQKIAETGGAIPATVAELRALPGVGPYTAGAIASIAFGVATPLVDGNVIRVLSRWAAIPGDPARAPTRRAIWDLAGQLVDPDRPGDFNQALMEVGSTVCTPTSPDCPSCPLAATCQARLSESIDRFPETAPRTVPSPMRARAALVLREQKGHREILLRRRPPTGLLAGLWEAPSVEATGTTFPPVSQLEELFRSARTGDLHSLHPGHAEVEHVFSHRRLRLRIHLADLRRPHLVDSDSTLPEDWAWFSLTARKELGQSALLKKVLAHLPALESEE